MKRNRLRTLSLALPAALLIIWFSVHASSETRESLRAAEHSAERAVGLAAMARA